MTVHTPFLIWAKNNPGHCSITKTPSQGQMGEKYRKNSGLVSCRIAKRRQIAWLPEKKDFQQPVIDCWKNVFVR
jgi:hypothetical protein